MLYENNNTARKIPLRNRLMTLRMQEDNPTAGFLHHIQDVINQLSQIVI